MSETPRLYRTDFIDGSIEPTETNTLYCWVGVRDDGLVAMDDIRQFDDELEKLANGWSWKKFILVPETELAEAQARVAELENGIRDIIHTDKHLRHGTEIILLRLLKEEK